MLFLKPLAAIILHAMKNIILFIIFCFAFIKLSAQAQAPDSMMKIYAENFPQQKVHLHFDKSFYRAGETIWFKAYLFEGFNPAIASFNLYAELIDSNGKIIERKTYPVIESSAAGHFDIPLNSSANAYTVRAYTSWMLNYDTTFLYQKPITILSQKENEEKKNQASPIEQKTQITFFPEGGNLVAGLENIVAFKANDEKGLPVNVIGVINNNKGSEVAKFKSIHNGMGQFSLKPIAGESYLVLWKDSTGVEKTTDLPLVSAEGVTLSIQLLKDKLVYKVARTENVPILSKSLNIVAHTGQHLAYRAKLNLDETSITSGLIPIKQVPSGVLQITLFNNNWEPIAERVVLVNNKLHLLEADIVNPIINLEKRGRNVIEVEVEDTVLTNLSISVTDAAIGQFSFEDNIISRLLLTGDLKGYIHQPGYYFSNASDSTSTHLDLVMLTHGWRKFNWQNIARKKTPFLKFPFETPLKIEAKVYGLGAGVRLQDDERLLAFIEGKDSTNTMVIFPKTGPDIFSLPLSFYDTVKVFYQFQKNKQLGSSASISISNNFYKGKPHVNLANLNYLIPPNDVVIQRTRLLASEMAKYKSDFNTRGNVLETVTVRSKVKTRKEQLDENYTSGLFKGDGQSFDMMDGNNNLAINVFAFLQGRVAGLTVNDAMGMNPTVTWRGDQTAFFLNEISVDAQVISTLSIIDIAYIKVMRPPFFGSIGGGSGGAIAIYTKKGNDAPIAVGQGMSRAKVAGYSISKEFYSPNYSNRAASLDVTADYRTTLYWQPFIFTGKDNSKVKIEFYNNDISKAFRIILEGVNEYGKIIRIEKIVQQ